MITQVEFEKTIPSIIEEVAFDDKVRCAYLTGTINDGAVLIDGIHIPEQILGPCSTKIEPKIQTKAWEAIRNQGRVVVGEVVSHGYMSVFESMINQRGREQLDQTLGRTTVLLVVNNKGDHKIFFDKPKCVCKCTCGASKEVNIIGMESE